MSSSPTLPFANFGTQTEFTTGFPGSSACKQQIMRLLSLHNHENQFLNWIFSYISLYISSRFYFSEETLTKTTISLPSGWFRVHFSIMFRTFPNLYSLDHGEKRFLMAHKIRLWTSLYDHKEGFQMKLILIMCYVLEEASVLNWKSWHHCLGLKGWNEEVSFFPQA